MKEFFKLIDHVIGPDKNWSFFIRKVLSTLLVATIGAYSWHEYTTFNRSHWEELPLHTAIRENGIEQKVLSYLNTVISAHMDHLKSVWVYSWPDARTLLPVAHAGSPENPIPLGYFQVTDAHQVGELVMEQCTELHRHNKRLIACPIMAENDAWGVVVFECLVDCDEAWLSHYQALAHKLAHLIYSNHD